MASVCQIMDGGKINRNKVGNHACDEILQINTSLIALCRLVQKSLFKILEQNLCPRAPSLDYFPKTLAIRLCWLVGCCYCCHFNGLQILQGMEGLFGRFPWHSFERDLANKVSWFLELDKYEPATPGRSRRNEHDQHLKMNTFKGQRERVCLLTVQTKTSLTLTPRTENRVSFDRFMFAHLI